MEIEEDKSAEIETCLGRHRRPPTRVGDGDDHAISPDDHAISPDDDDNDDDDGDGNGDDNDDDDDDDNDDDDDDDIIEAVNMWHLRSLTILPGGTARSVLAYVGVDQAERR